jgi:hypothetical protein
MAESQSIPFSFKVILAVMLVLLAAGIFGAVAWFTQTPERTMLLQMDALYGAKIEIFSGDTYIGTTPCDVPLEVLRRHTQIELGEGTWPPAGPGQGATSVSDVGWSMSFSVRPGTGAGEFVLHIMEEEGDKGLYLSIPLKVGDGSTEWLGSAIGTGDKSSFSMGRRQYSQRIVFTER